MTSKKVAYTAGGDTRKPGAKGLQTRRHIIDVTLEQLSKTRLRDLTVAQIAREASVSPGTFYVYFKDVTDVVLAALDETSQSTPRLLQLLGDDWSPENASTLARTFVTEYVAYWQSHRTLFRIRNLASEEGDVRFTRSRQVAVRELLVKLSDIVRQRQQDGKFRKDLKPEAVAGTLTALLERIAAVAGVMFAVPEGTPQSRFAFPALSADEMIASTAHYVALTLSE